MSNGARISLVCFFTNVTLGSVAQSQSVCISLEICRPCEIYETWHATYTTWHVIHALPPLTSQIFRNDTQLSFHKVGEDNGLNNFCALASLCTIFLQFRQLFKGLIVSTTKLEATCTQFEPLTSFRSHSKNFPGQKSQRVGSAD